jgi:hypothetical protein
MGSGGVRDCTYTANSSIIGVCLHKMPILSVDDRNLSIATRDWRRYYLLMLPMLTAPFGLYAGRHSSQRTAVGTL